MLRNAHANTEMNVSQFGNEEKKTRIDRKMMHFIRYVNKLVLFLKLHTLCTIWSVSQSWHFVSDGSCGRCIGTTQGGGTARKGAIRHIPLQSRVGAAVQGRDFRMSERVV